MPKVTKAVIAAAGLGSRMFPFAKVESKLMIPILNKPIVEYLIEELVASGIKEVIIVANHTAKIKQFFIENKNLNLLLKRLKKDKLLKNLHHIEHSAKVDLIMQEEPMGWMHEVVHAKDYIKKEPFVVCFSDTLYTSPIPAAKQVIDAFHKTNKNIRSLGRFLFKPYVLEIAQKERFMLGKDVADLDVFEKLKERNDLFNLNINGKFHDVGNPLSYLKTQTYFGLHNKILRRAYGEYLKDIIK